MRLRLKPKKHMLEQNDKALHDWVRQTLHGYQPADYDAQEWKRMKRRLEIRRWWRFGTICFICLLMSGIAGWYLMNIEEREIPEKAAVDTSLKSLSIIRDSMAAVLKLQIPEQGSIPSKDTAIKPNPEILSVSSFITKRLHIANLSPLKLKHEKSDVFEGLIEKLPHLAPIFNTEESAIRYQMLTGQFGADSTTYKAFTRNLHRWPNAVVVCDLTTSMYPYSTQLFAWFKQNSKHSPVKGMVFFTDCDSTGRQTQPDGLAGQMFVSRESNVTKVLPVILHAARNTIYNHDEAENDIEALLFAQNEFPQARHLILLADNSSQVKDMQLLNKINKPVHVVLCGTTLDSTQAFQPDYYTIASRTKGSLHTIEDDIKPNKITTDSWIRVGQYFYHYNARKSHFKVTRFHHRPKHFLGLFWL